MGPSDRFVPLSVPATMSMSPNDTLLLAPPRSGTLTAGRKTGRPTTQPVGRKWPPAVMVIASGLLVPVNVVPVAFTVPPGPTISCAEPKPAAGNVNEALLLNVTVPLSVSTTPLLSTTGTLLATVSVASAATVKLPVNT